MKVGELRELISKSSPENIQKAFVECYKQLPKAKKEEADPVLEGILSGKAEVRKEKSTVVNYETLTEEMDRFLENAYAGNYLAPNREVPKSQRPKWRFQVKGYIKTLEAVRPNEEFYRASGEYLLKLYRLLADACNVYLFSSDDAFRSVGISQGDLYRMMAERILDVQGCTKATLKLLLWQAASGGLSRESLHKEQVSEFICCLRTDEERHLAVEAGRELIHEKTEELSGATRDRIERYSLEDGINETDQAVLWITAMMDEMGVNEMAWYFNNSKQYDEEITLYCGLRILRYYICEEGWEDNWLRLYNYAVSKRKTEPRTELQETYQELTNRQPEETEV